MPRTLKKEPGYTKAQILASKAFNAREKDLLEAILKNESYSLNEAKALLTKELERVID